MLFEGQRPPLLQGESQKAAETFGHILSEFGKPSNEGAAPLILSHLENNLHLNTFATGDALPYKFLALKPLVLLLVGMNANTAMAENSTYHIVLIPKLTASDDNINALAQKFRDFRLGALTTSPDAFASTYELEIKRGLDLSIERLATSKAAQYVALRRVEQVTDPFEQNDVIKCLLHEDWTGINVLLGPEEGDDLSVPSVNLDPFHRMTANTPSLEVAIDGMKDLHFHVNGMYVDPVARGSGLGARLMEAVLGRARAEGTRYGKAVRVTLSVYSHNEAAYALYLKAGFRVTSRAISRSRPPSEAIHMQFDIAAPTT